MKPPRYPIRPESPPRRADAGRPPCARYRRSAALLLLALADLSLGMAWSANDITMVERELYGPGPFPDQRLSVGYVRNLEFTEFMRATVKAFNNGGKEPNVSGEALQGTAVDGQMSDGTLINENIDMGNAVIANGQFNLLLGAVFGGPNRGDSLFFLDPQFNWTIQDDIAIDPGFSEGVIKIDDFIFSTGPRAVPLSIQSQRNYPGGVDRVGSLSSGDIVVGRVGDDDFDGFVDGVFMAIGNFPLTSAFLPGAPFVQRIVFASDIPITSVDAALLSVASVRNSTRTHHDLTARTPPRADTAKLIPFAMNRLETAIRHLERVVSDSTVCAPDCAAVSELLARCRRLTEADMRSDAKRVERIFEELYAMYQGRTKRAAR